MILLPDFKIQPTGNMSQACLDKGLPTFHEVVDVVWKLPYGRNTDKNNLLTVFTDGCGTCSTKHALLKQLALENNRNEIRLMIGLFRMNGKNTPPVARRLEQNKIEFIPEAHCYLMVNGNRFDFTKSGPRLFDFEPDLIEEVEILPGQITDYKVAYQKNYLKSWLADQPAIPYSLDELWAIREQCIQDLSN